MDRNTARHELGVPAGANAEQVRAAFRRLAREGHPDLGGSRERFEALVSARNALLAPSQAPRLVVRERSLWQQTVDLVMEALGLGGPKRPTGRVQ